MVAELPPERDFRGPGCSVDCRAIRALLPGQFGRWELMLHDPETHEEFGRRCAGFVPVSTDLLVTGLLSIDFLGFEVTVDGESVHLTPTEYKVLFALARQPGRVVLQSVLLHQVWNGGTADRLLMGADAHLLRVVMARLRGKLGRAQTLIRTRPGLGYLLEMIEPGDVLPAQPLHPGRNRRLTTWAKQWSQCRDCGTTEIPHVGHGRCQRCRDRPERRAPIGTDS